MKKNPVLSCQTLMRLSQIINHMEVGKMKKRMITMVAVLLLLVSIMLPITEARAAMLSLLGSSTMTPAGKSVTFGGSSVSSVTEDTIKVSSTLWEQRSGTWYAVSSVTKTKENAVQVSASKTYTVSGGHYYRVTSTHTSKTGATTHTATSSTASRWIPE